MIFNSSLIITGSFNFSISNFRNNRKKEDVIIKNDPTQSKKYESKINTNNCYEKFLKKQKNGVFLYKYFEKKLTKKGILSDSKNY